MEKMGSNNKNLQETMAVWVPIIKIDIDIDTLW